MPVHTGASAHVIASRAGYGPYSAAWIVAGWPPSPVTFTVSVIAAPGAAVCCADLRRRARLGPHGAP